MFRLSEVHVLELGSLVYFAAKKKQNKTKKN